MAQSTQAIIYEVNLAVETDVVERFDEWLVGHTQLMLAIPGFVSASTSVPDVEDEEIKYRCVQFRLIDQAALDRYLKIDAERMRAKLTTEFGDQVKAERRVLSVAEASVAQQSACANCGAELAGRFCNVCGQREEPRVPTVGALLGELTNEMFGVESRLWRSFAKLFFAPGELSRVFLNGQRQKYMSPIRLYLLFSIMTFAYFTLMSNYTTIELPTTSEEAATQEAQTQETDSEPSVTVNMRESAREELQREIKTANETVNQELAEALKEEGVSTDGFVFNSGFFSEETDKRISDKLHTSFESIRKDIENGNQRAVFAKFFEPLPTALFIFLPIVALLFKILFLGSGKYYVEHLIYILHNHAFMFIVILLSSASGLVERWTPDLNGPIAAAIIGILILTNANKLITYGRNALAASAVKGFLKVSILVGALAFAVLNAIASGFSFLNTMLWTLYVPYYLYRSLRVVYGRGRWATVLTLCITTTAYIVLLGAILVGSAAFVGLTYES